MAAPPIFLLAVSTAVVDGLALGTTLQTANEDGLTDSTCLLVGQGLEFDFLGILFAVYVELYSSCMSPELQHFSF